MQVFNYIEINLFALVILFLIYLNMRQFSGKYLFEHKIYMAMLAVNAIILVLDTFMWTFDGLKGSFFHQANLISAIAYFIMNPVPCMLWVIFIDYFIFHSMQRIRKLIVPLFIPVIVNLFLSFASISGKFMFYIDASNVYHRGHLFLLIPICGMPYVLYSLIIIVINNKRIEKKYFLPALSFVFPPAVCIVLQTMFYGVSIIWAALTISLLIIFMNMQNDRVYCDYLTGLYNRRQLDIYMESLSRSDYGHMHQAGIMIDVNSFKQINDNYGHVEGDNALKSSADIIKKCLKKGDFLARYGGDEFLAVVMVHSSDDLKKIADSIKSAAKRFNEKNSLPYALSFGIGYDVYDAERWPKTHDFVMHIDKLMYKNKEASRIEVQVH